MEKYRKINLEDDMPTVVQAMSRLNLEVTLARRQGVKIMKIIHGFGSTGNGGKIRLEARKQLEVLKRRGILKYYITGEKLSIFDENTRKAMDYCSELRGDSDLERHNNGITIVVL